MVLRRGNHRPRREPDRLLSAPPDRANARKYLSDRTLPRDDARALPVCREGACDTNFPQASEVAYSVKYTSLFQVNHLVRPRGAPAVPHSPAIT